MVLSIIVLFLWVLKTIGLWKLFEKAGRKGWEAAIPLYNYFVIIQLAGRPSWWGFILLLPIINIILIMGLIVDLSRCFGKFSFLDHAAAVLLPFVYFNKWGFDPGIRYLGKSASGEFKLKYPYKKSAGREWADAIIFAVVAATLIRTFFIQAYTIPSGSMEKSLLIGDFLFVSNMNYGARVPITPVAFPFAHHTMPVTGTKAYWEGIQLDYHRLPGFQKISRNDVVVFNYPMEADAPFNRPVDKRENYIKRCLAIPGDTLRIINAQVYVNGKAAENPSHYQKYYIVVTDGSDFNPQTLQDMNIEAQHIGDNDYAFNMTAEQAEQIKNWPIVKSVKVYVKSPGEPNTEMFPNDSRFKWNEDNFGPVIIPKKGWTVKLDSTTIPMYKRAIETYEHNIVKEDGGRLIINGKPSASYTFTMDYYWMMGDNRDNSLDSRFWGFVPEDHIVGKALFVWLSLDANKSFFNKVRWNRIFTAIK